MIFMLVDLQFISFLSFEASKCLVVFSVPVARTSFFFLLLSFFQIFLLRSFLLLNFLNLRGSPDSLTSFRILNFLRIFFFIVRDIFYLFFSSSTQFFINCTYMGLTLLSLLKGPLNISAFYNPIFHLIFVLHLRSFVFYIQHSQLPHTLRSTNFQ